MTKSRATVAVAALLAALAGPSPAVADAPRTVGAADFAAAEPSEPPAPVLADPDAGIFALPETPELPAAPEAGPVAAPAGPPAVVSGRAMYDWYAEPGLRVVVVIDGFAVEHGEERVIARDGVIWFDEGAATATGRAPLGVYAESDAEHRRPDGSTRTYDSVFLVIQGVPALRLESELPPQGKAESTPLYLRAKMRRREFIERGQMEEPLAVTPPERPPVRPPVPGLREARVPQPITIVPRDAVTEVNFTSKVEDDVRVSTWTGGLIVIRGEMEMAADSVVVWTPEDAVREAAGAAVSATEGVAAEAYFEGSVHLVVGHRQFFCRRLYYDFRRDIALAVDAKIKTFSYARNVPVYYYAKELRQLAEEVFVGKDARITTDEFGVPNYDIAASELLLVDLSAEPAEGEPFEEEPALPERRVRFAGKDLQFRIRRVPLTWWPEMGGDFAEGETALRTVRIEHGSNRGTGITSQWHLMRLLGLEREPPGFDFHLNADFWSDRGPGLGVESDYARKDFYGEFLSYYLNDTGKDSIGDVDVEPPSRHRGRVRWQHRHYLPEDWELTFELSYLSDPNFLNEFYEEEDEQGKAQETLLYLKKQSQDEAGLPTDQTLTLLNSWRLNDFNTRTEFLPQVGYNVIGHSLADDRLTYFQDSEVAYARFRPDDRTGVRGSNGELIADTIHEVDLPLKVGPVGVVPFGEVRYSYFEEDLAREGSRTRLYWRAGARAALQLWRPFPDVRSNFWDLHGIRHIHTFDTRAYTANTSVPMEDLIPYDVTEAGTAIWQGVTDVGVVEMGWRQRFQTKRGPPDRRRTVDWLVLDLEAFFHHNRDSPFPLRRDGKRAFNHLGLLTNMRVTDSTNVWTDTNWNTEEGVLDFFAAGLTVHQSPRFSYSLDHRYIPDGDTSRSTLSADYRINPKWRLTFLEQFEWNDTRNAESQVILTRRMNRWLVRLRFEVDPSEDETFVGVEVQPMGAPEVRFGT